MRRVLYQDPVHAYELQQSGCCWLLLSTGNADRESTYSVHRAVSVQVPKATRVAPHPVAGTTRINLTFRKCAPA